jgi:Ala-tRNA(Pro) deacylase
MNAFNWIRKVLELRGIPFAEFHHSEAYTAQEVAHHEHFTGHRVAKVVVVMADGRPIELILPASRRVLLDRVREILAAQEVHLATEAEMDRIFPGCESGAIPALRYRTDVPVLMDRTLTVEGNILFQMGTHSDAVLVRFSDWFDLVEPEIASFSEPADPAHRTVPRVLAGAAP